MELTLKCIECGETLVVSGFDKDAAQAELDKSGWILLGRDTWTTDSEKAVCSEDASGYTLAHRANALTGWL